MKQQTNSPEPNLITVSVQDTLRDALRVISEGEIGACFAIGENNQFAGIVTDGDVRRALLSDLALDSKLSDLKAAEGDNTITVPADSTLTHCRKVMEDNGIQHLPLVNSDGVLVDVVGLNHMVLSTPRDNYVVLMAGGLGSRLMPLTAECPKPLLPVRGTPILEKTILAMRDHGFRKFLISVNYLGNMIEDYFGDGSSLGVEIEYLHETMRQGTGGALSLIEHDLKEPFLVLNGDVLTDLDFGELINHHEEEAFEATMVVRLNRVIVPFGVVETDENEFVGIKEKPSYQHMVNAGIYVLNPSTLKHVPAKTFFDLPDLFSNLTAEEQRCGVFSFYGKWIDIGSLDDYKRVNNE